MSLAELLPAIRALPREEQVQLMHLLVDEMSKEMPLTTEEALLRKLFSGGLTIDVVSPIECYGAAQELQELLDNSKQTSGEGL
jgi:hypothetical protein